jgi:hypothetical protein
MIRFYSRECLLIVPILFAVSPALFADSIVIDFEGLNDSTFLTTQYADVTFSNAIVLTAGISLNELDFPPRSGINVASDFGGPMSIAFATPVLDFLAYFTYALPVTIQAFDSAHDLLASAVSSFGNNTLSGGDPGSGPNELIEVSSSSGFSTVVITGDPTGSSFALDDATYSLGGAPSIPEPATLSLALIGLGLLFAAKAGRRR